MELKTLYNIIFFIFTTLILFSTALSNCPCNVKDLCKPINKTYDQEVFIFSLKKENWPKYDWTRITTIVEVGYHSPELVCFAHKKGARVVSIANFQPAHSLTNKTARTEWIEKTIKYVQENYLDGVNVDFESPIYENQTDLRESLTTLMNDLTSGIKAISSNLQVTIDYAWSPHCIDSRCFDYQAIAQTVDFAFVMAYDERSQIFYDCTAWANSAYNQTKMGVEAFIKMGIPNKKLVLGVPWYGYNYPCEKYYEVNTTCYIKSVPFRGVLCSDAAGRQVSYAEIIQKLLPMATTQLMWDNPSKSPYFNYKDSNSSQLHQIWFDNPASLKIKYNYAKEAGLRGVGMWEADDLDYGDSEQGEEIRREMWGALPEH